MEFLFWTATNLLENSVNKKEGWTWPWGTSNSSCPIAFPESLSSLLHGLRSHSGDLWQTPTSKPPRPHSSIFHSKPSSKRRFFQEQAVQAGLSVSLLSLLPPEMGMESGNLILPSFPTKLNKHFWKIMTQGMAISLRSQTILLKDARRYFFFPPLLSTGNRFLSSVI